MRNTLLLFCATYFICAFGNIQAQDLINFKYDSLYYADSYYMILIDEPWISEQEMEMLSKDWEEKRSLRSEEDLKELLDENVIAIDLFLHPTSGVSQLVAFTFDPIAFTGLRSGSEFPTRGNRLATMLVSDQKIRDGMMYTYLKALDQMMDWGEAYPSFAHLQKRFKGNEWIPKGHQVLVDSLKIPKAYTNPEMREKIGAKNLELYKPWDEKKWYEVEEDQIIILDRLVENRRNSRIIHTYFLSLNGGLRFYVAEELSPSTSDLIGRGYLAFLFDEKPGNAEKLQVRYAK